MKQKPDASMTTRLQYDHRKWCSISKLLPDLRVIYTPKKHAKDWLQGKIRWAFCESQGLGTITIALVTTSCDSWGLCDNP